ncbi:oligoendopeptidase F [Telmatocola sphagniphila]|uniref:Oligopeptidase F n=1 Tax=Telmatocola sphagniphila TaxID=1123043 RepID=A0A8E6EUR8_9BACT|nr:oligoendopeptidase F [Telmatocola sphagniphila]QVL31750.1 oligoendopeptidase F [Telmatocola sphagniphila]
MSSGTKKLPLRSEVPVGDTWDLNSLFESDAAWEKTFEDYEKKAEGYNQFRGKLGESAQLLSECLKFDTAFDRLGDRIGTYAFLKETEDVSNSNYQGMKARYIGVASRAAELASYIRPEILNLPNATLGDYLKSPLLAEYKLSLERLVRYKPHTLSEKEERILAMQIETSQTPRNVFDQLTDADLKFGEIELSPGEKIELSHSSYIVCLENPNREVRKTAFHQYYSEFNDHANTLAATLAGSIKQDVYQARVRNFSSAREASLFPDKVPLSVYDNLLTAIHNYLPAVHKYYQVRRKAMKLPDIHMYDTYVPILSDLQTRNTWDEGVEKVIAALKPLGSEYIDALTKGLKGRWCDRYENKGKHSGAFSSGCYDSDPYILMNYQPDVLDHIFTLAHEAGHSMHTWYSSKNQPYQYANYTIFVAEVASTFNEQLLGEMLRKTASNAREKAYYLNREIDDIRKTIVRQTMFAEFEKVTHALAEENEPLTLETLRAEYRKLLDAYFGPEFTLDEELSLECLRIPHFYRAFYVYKYATGLSAAIALSERVLHGGKSELDAYLGFLKSGSSKDPLDLLRGAGVDMETPEPVEAALKKFARMVDELDQLLN